MQSLITDHIDIWTSAQTQKMNGNGQGNGNTNQNLYGIKKLRELILELAVRGKLVPQDPGDEPASVLLDKIAKEKARLVKEGKIKKEKPLPEISEEEKQFELPDGWEWVRLETCIELVSGQHLQPGEYNESGEGMPYLTGPSDFGAIEPIANRWTHTVKAISVQNDILITVKGSGIGKTNVLGYEKAAMGRQLMAVRPIIMNRNFMKTVLDINYNVFQGKRIGIAIPGIGRDEILHHLMALPPLAEQHRIVAKVDELMAICDQLEQQQTDNDSLHQTLVDTLLSTLTDAADPGELELAWQRIADHFVTLFITERSIDQLKQAILQLAVMGKLVPQDPSDEPASVLLEKIAKEKARLIKEGKIKKEKPLPEIGEDEKSFELPDGWKWTRFGNCYDVRDGTHASPKPKPKGFPLVTSKNLYSGRLDLSNVNFISEEDHLRIIERSKVDRNDILLAMIGSIGNPLIVDTDVEFSIKNVALFKYYCRELSVPKYLKVVLDVASRKMRENASGGVQSFISLGKLRQHVVALPPLIEQHRIVAKVDELMAVCDALKAWLKEAQTTQIQLADTIVEQAV